MQLLDVKVNHVQQLHVQLLDVKINYVRLKAGRENKLRAIKTKNKKKKKKKKHAVAGRENKLRAIEKKKKQKKKKQKKKKKKKQRKKTVDFIFVLGRVRRILFTLSIYSGRGASGGKEKSERVTKDGADSGSFWTSAFTGALGSISMLIDEESVQLSRQCLFKQIIALAMDALPLLCNR